MSNHRSFITLGEARGPLFVGADLGGTNIKVGVVDDLGRPLSWHTVRTDAQTGPADGARHIAAAVLKAIELAGVRPADVAPRWTGLPRHHGHSGRHAARPAQFARLDQFPAPRSGERTVRPAGHLRQRRRSRSLWRVLDRLRPRREQPGAVHAGNRHRLRNHCRWHVDRRRASATGPNAGT